MNKSETYYPDLMARYLSGEATPEEVRELSIWVNSDPANAQVFKETRKGWLAMAALQVEEQTDLDLALKELKKKIAPQVQPKKAPAKPVKLPSLKKKAERKPPPIAKLKQPQKPEPLAPVHEAPIVVEETREVIQMEPAGIDWRVTLIRAVTIAAIFLVMLVPAWIAYRYFTAADITRISAGNEMMETTLPDGTIVTLNAFATISYGEEFGNELREIELKGEAYFDVVPAPAQPFVITSEQARVEVLGTSFYINTLKNGGDVQVVLVDGSLSVYFEDNHGERKTLIPGEKAELFQANQRIMVSPNEDPNFLAWKTRRMIFLDDRLDVIVQTLNSVYHANISLATEELAACRLTASFNRQTLESVLSVIQATLDLSSESSSDEIILFGAGCR